VEVCDPDVPIATLNEGGHLKLQAQVRWGRGYATAEKNFDESMGIGWIPVDSVHSPVRKVNYRVEAARLGRTTDYERLVVEVWTNGTITPQESVSLASDLLREHLGIFVAARTSALEELEAMEETEESALEPVLAKSVDELNLSVRTANCLKNAGVHTVGELVQKSRKEMLETKNLGKKSLEELESTLEELELGFRSENEDIEE
jgi:DNA-directed RNA polymerase subunit alpha